MSENNKTSEAFERGMKVRKEVLGAAHVERSLKNADAFSRPLQEYLTEACWDTIWNRPGFDRRSRSILNLGMLAALNRPNELKLHIRGAINNGLTREELQEAFLQVGAYCGAPAAIDCFRVAREVFAELDGA